jgi:hypothetical protein
MEFSKRIFMSSVQKIDNICDVKCLFFHEIVLQYVCDVPTSVHTDMNSEIYNKTDRETACAKFDNKRISRVSSLNEVCTVSVINSSLVN